MESLGLGLGRGKNLGAKSEKSLDHHSKLPHKRTFPQGFGGWGTGRSPRSVADLSVLLLPLGSFRAPVQRSSRAQPSQGRMGPVDTHRMPAPTPAAERTAHPRALLEFRRSSGVWHFSDCLRQDGKIRDLILYASIDFFIAFQGSGPTSNSSFLNLIFLSITSRSH